MANEQYQNYYKAPTDVLNRLMQEHEPIEAQRQALTAQFLQQTGAITFTRRTLWEGQESIAQLVYPEHHDIAKSDWVKVIRKSVYEGQPVVCLTGKQSRKEGKALNDQLAAINEQLKPFPGFSTWLLQKYNLMRSGLGGIGSKGFGQNLLHSRAGRAGPEDAPVLVVTIPKGTPDERVEPVALPEWLEPITYGQFYDLTNPA